MKKCSKCKKTKVSEDFYSNKKTKDGKASWCKSCHKAWVRSKQIETGYKSPNKANSQKKWKSDNTVAIKLRKYNVTQDGYDELAKEGICPICLREWDKPNFDHCHDTGKFRGLLCSSCNKGLGFFGDDLERLESAVVYLRNAQNRL